jgi:uncharacterized membrane protein YdjX (TVP38/TMEM64 family)
MNKSMLKKILLIIGIVGAFWGLYHFTPLHDYITLASLQERSYSFKLFVDQHYWLSLFIYMAVFIVTIALSLPSSIVLTLLGGYLFGAIQGALCATISVTLGVLIAYSFFRLFLQDLLRDLYKTQAEEFEKAMRKNGISYLLMLHFSAVLPYFIINAFAALARIPICTVIGATFVGFLPQGIIFAYAGKEFSHIAHVNDIFSWKIIVVFALLMLAAFVPVAINRYKSK